MDHEDVKEAGVRMVSYQDLRVQSTTETSDSVKQLLKQENKNATDKKDIRKC